MVVGAILAMHAALLGGFGYYALGRYRERPTAVDTGLQDRGALSHNPKHQVNFQVDIAMPQPRPAKRQSVVKPALPVSPIVALASTPRPGGPDTEKPQRPADGGVETDSRSSPRPVAQGQAKTPSAVGSSPSERIKALGLHLEDPYYVLDGEIRLKQQFREAATRYMAYEELFVRKARIAQYEVRAQALQQEINERQIEINQYNAGLAEADRNRANSDEIAEARQRRAALNEIQAEAKRALKVIRSQLPGAPDRQQLNDELERRRRECGPLVAELRELIDSTNAKYDQLRKDEQLKNVLGGLNLGPRAEFTKMTKQVSFAQRLLDSPDEMMETVARQLSSDPGPSYESAGPVEGDSGLYGWDPSWGTGFVWWGRHVFPQHTTPGAGQGFSGAGGMGHGGGGRR
jgi:hypothetical protein